MEFIDLYCERLGPGLLAEPINLFTNLGFPVAAYAMWRLASRLGQLDIQTWLLIAVCVVVGIGSGLFHSFATQWAQILDIVPILLLQLLFLWTYGRRLVGVPAPLLAAGLALYVGAALLGRQLPHVLNGSLIYTPAFVLTVVLGLYHHAHMRVARSSILVGAAVLLLALMCRSLDQALCVYFPVGTHFGWHLLSALLFYLIVRALLLNLPRPQEEAST